MDSGGELAGRSLWCQGYFGPDFIEKNKVFLYIFYDVYLDYSLGENWGK